MSTAPDVDGSEDVNDFLLRIRELGDQRDKEDEERTRKLEEEIIQGRKERQARRAERARSLSPTKDTSTNVGTSASREPAEILAKPPIFPKPSSPGINNMDDIVKRSNGPSLSVKSPEASSPTSEFQPRTSRLSWQQRPQNRPGTNFGGHQTPIKPSEDSVKDIPGQARELGEEDGEDMSRSRIAQSLGSKDPSWFKQTPDRGHGSAAYRKNRDGSGSDTSSWTGSVRLPGMGKDNKPASKSSMSPPAPSESSFASSRPSSQRGLTRSESQEEGSPPTSISTSNNALARSIPPPNASQESGSVRPDAASPFGDLEKPSLGRNIAMSPSQGRLSPDKLERPASPTKGLGGFVQSAMMKRSDSVSKRWSATVSPGLSRGNSIASNRGGLDAVRSPFAGAAALTDMKSIQSRETTPTASSRPTSSDSNDNAYLRKENQVPWSRTSGTFNNLREAPENPSKISVSPTSSSSAQQMSVKSKFEEPIKSPPMSPSKRWSPTKASWLENAISKPESPKVTSPPPVQQPAWMASINRAKQQRGSVDLSTSQNFKEVSTQGLMRSPPPGISQKSPSFHNIPNPSSMIPPKPDGNKQSLHPARDSAASQPVEDVEASVMPSSSASSRQSDELRMAGDQADIKPLLGSDMIPKRSTEESKEAKKTDDNTVTPLKVKSKPETPLKKDFRSGLKAREISEQGKAQDEPEFKNVFGKLKKTQTQNYKAPDELKDNILRGKAGLLLTGGPKKTEIRDEFKESILKKKQGMVAPSASTKITSASSKRQESTVPEAIAKRQGLSRADSRAGQETIIDDSTISEASQKVLRSSGDTSKRIDQDQAKKSPELSAKGPQSATGGNFAASLAGVLKKGPPTPANKADSRLTDQETPQLSTGKSEETNDSPNHAPLTHTTKSRARGPKRKPPTSTLTDSSKTTKILPGQDLVPESPLRESKPTLSRITSIPPPSFNPTKQTSSPTGEWRNQGNIQKSENSRNLSDRGIRTPDPKSPLTPSTAAQKKSPPVVKEKPNLSPKSPQDDIESPRPRASVVAGKSHPSPKASPLTPNHEEHLSRTRPPQDMTGGERPFEIPRNILRSTASNLDRGKDTREDTDSKIKNGGFSKDEPKGLGIATGNPIPKSSSETSKIEPSWPKGSKSPPLPGRKPQTVDLNLSREPPRGQAESTPKSSPIKKTSGAGRVYGDLFDEVPASYHKFNMDTQSILDARITHESSPKLKTLRKQIFEIADNGKLLPVPAHQEHILFEESIYLCTHVFGTFSGTKMTEVYLWCGDGVSSSAVEDAQLFGKRAAKENNGKLILLKQGKETPNFFQALGGIVIVRKGSSARTGSLQSQYMLCGRRHLGQIAFDEVPYSRRGLCQGFPFVICAPGGKHYLWKGKGAGFDELGCARLIGMDLGTNGEIEEIEQGGETGEFWATFQPEASEPELQSGHPPWHLKSSCERYHTRLFSVGAEPSRPKSSSGFMSWGRRGSAPSVDANVQVQTQVKEVTPFTQLDLLDDIIFVLDTFFEIYVIHPLRTLSPAPQHRSTKSLSFRAGLLFAQEYAILAASAQDRPSVPRTSVAFISKDREDKVSNNAPQDGEYTEIPEGLKRAFRKWDETIWGHCTVFELQDALEGCS